MRIIEALIENGFYIIPFESKQKRPLKQIGLLNNFVKADQSIERLSKFQFDTFAIKTGEKSGGYTVLDIDNKNYSTGDLNKEFLLKLKKKNEELLNKLYIETTTHNGLHIGFKINFDTDESKVLARSHENKGIIELFTNQPIVSAPSPNYQVVQNSIINAPLLTRNEFEFLITVAKSFDQRPVVETPKVIKKTETENKESMDNPFYAYDQSDDWINVLENHGWKKAGSCYSEIYFKRPGKNKGVSASFNKENKKLYVFSSNAYPLEGEQSYQPYAIFAFLECNQDFKLARKKLLEMGFGKAKVFKSDNNKLHRNGFIQFKQQFFFKNGEINTEILDVVYTNRALYNLYKEFCQSNQIPTKMKSKEFTTLIRNAYNGGHGIKVKTGRKNFNREQLRYTKFYLDPTYQIDPIKEYPERIFKNTIFDNHC